MSHQEIMCQGGFQVVASKRAIKRGRIVNPLRISGTRTDIDAAISKATICIIQSGIHKWLLAKLDEGFRSLGTEFARKGRILLLGNGHFDARWEAGAHQLALIKIIAEHFKVVLEIQDPCFTDAELEWINGSNGSVQLTERAQFNSVTSPTFVVCIHSPHFLINAFLKSNWNQEALKQVIFLGNDYSSTSLESTDPNHEALIHFSKSSRYLTMPIYEPNSSFFYETSLFFWESIESDEMPTLMD